MRSLIAVCLVLVTSACPAPTAPGCGPSNCFGCCAADDSCVVTTSATACGGNGLACQLCAQGERCLIDRCVAETGTGGGSGGGATGGGTGGGSTCAPETDAQLCAAASRSCGFLSVIDRCGVRRSLDCGGCTSPTVCSTAGACVCQPEGDAQLCSGSGNSCGVQTLTDACGTQRTLSCGTCPTNTTCGGGGSGGVCGCTAETDAAFCARNTRSCGALTAVDNCGRSRSVTSCGACSGTNTCTAGTCSCPGETNLQFCSRLGATCGTQTALDTCGQTRSVSCGTCTAPRTCGGGTQANVCGCTAESNPTFCARLGKNCGSATAQDNCGTSRTVDCGTCSGVESCGGGGTSNGCGCTAETDTAFCSRLGQSCGPVTATDNCGLARTVLSCGGTHQCPTAGEVQCSSGALRTCSTASNGCRVLSAPTACAGGFCGTSTSCGACTNTCSTVGATQCSNGAQQTCVADTNGCRSWSAATSCPNGCRDTLICEPCLHECAAWGATCAAGNVLETCVYDANRCRKKLTEVCSLGCGNGQCTQCASPFAPKLSSAGDAQLAFFNELVVQGSTAMTSWTERYQQYTEPDGGLTTFNVGTVASLAKVTELPLSDYFDAPRSLNWVGNRLSFFNQKGVQIFDTTTPLTPTPLTSYPRPGVMNDYNRSFSANGNRSCLGTDRRVELLDVTVTPPVRVGAVDGGVTAVACVGNSAVTLTYGALSVWDVADAGVPRLAAFTTQNSGNSRVFFDGSRIVTSNSYVSGQDSYSQLDTWTFSPPSTLTHVGSIRPMPAPLLGVIGSVASFGDEEIVGTADLSILAAPKLSKVIPFAPGARATATSGNTLFAAGDGLTSLDLTRASDVTLLARSSTDWIANSAVVGSIAYVARGTGLWIEDLRIPSAPVVMSKTVGFSKGVQLAGSVAWVAVEATGSMSLKSYDISSPWLPVLLGNVTLSPSGTSSPSLNLLQVDGNRAYAVCDIGSLCVFDVSNVSAPSLMVRSNAILATIGSSSSSSDFAEFGGGYLALPYSQGLKVVDLRSPPAFSTVGTVSFPGSQPSHDTVDIQIQGNTAYVLRVCPSFIGQTYEVCMETVDLSVPAAPVHRSTLVITRYFNTDRYPLAGGGDLLAWIRVEGKWAYVHHAYGGISMIDVSSATAPTLATNLWTRFQPGRSFVHDRYLTSFLTGVYPYPSSQNDQVMQLCQ